MPGGFDGEKLTRNLDRLLGGWVEKGALPCVRALVVRDGAVSYDKAFGWQDVEGRAPLRADSIFRLYSMTKVFTSVCMLMLLEEGRYKMHDPLSRFIPAFAHTQVAEYDEAGRPRLVAPRREIVMRDLFTMASGIPYPDGDTPPQRAMGDILRRYTKRMRMEDWDARRFLTDIAGAPLTFHPGEHWWYGYSIDVLGAMVEVLTGQRLGDFMRERIFTPLGLTDTGFYVPPEKRDRFVTMYQRNQNGAYAPVEEPYDAPPAFESGGGGLAGTAADVARFAGMLLGEGKIDGVRLLSRKSVELMRTNHLSEQQLRDYNWDTQRGYGYGLAVRVMMHPEIAGYGTVGEFAWDGMPGTWFSIDPTERLVNVFLVQILPGQHYEFVPNYAQVVYGAMED